MRKLEKFFKVRVFEKKFKNIFSLEKYGG